MTEPALQGVPDDLDDRTVRRAYRLWAPVYDVVCGSIFEQARRSAAEAATAQGGRILEIGIGTGLSMEHYRKPGIALYGIDLSSEMLARAQRRLLSGRHPHVRQLEVMDAHRLDFADGFFDSVVAPFVITLVARPEQVLSECVRVVRPGGQIVLVSHFYSERGLAARVERAAAAPLRRFGLRPEFPLDRLRRWAEADGRAELLDCRKVGLFGSYTVVRFRRKEQAGAGGAPAPAGEVSV
ncbi:MAG: class I SAM-dependent methyltransferase [Tistlia sp.]|uniref:class I SAM-dependent methyltransferase n=1 Tax=Tistlia sp. TaxID=3057121 RepID=UPI0034A298C4